VTERWVRAKTPPDTMPVLLWPILEPFDDCYPEYYCGSRPSQEYKGWGIWRATAPFDFGPRPCSAIWPQGGYPEYVLCAMTTRIGVLALHQWRVLILFSAVVKSAPYIGPSPIPAERTDEFLFARVLGGSSFAQGRVGVSLNAPEIVRQKGRAET